jgi:hypothetical protein
MSNTISSNPGIIDLREDYSGWSSSVNYEVPGYKNEENPAFEARAEYENDLYINALQNDIAHNDRESLAVETGQPLTPIREGGAQVNSLERVPGQGEMHAYATNEGAAIDPIHAEAVINSARETVNAALGYTESAQSYPETLKAIQNYNIGASSVAKGVGSNIEFMRDGADANWQSSAE